MQNRLLAKNAALSSGRTLIWCESISIDDNSGQSGRPSVSSEVMVAVDYGVFGVYWVVFFRLIIVGFYVMFLVQGGAESFE